MPRLELSLELTLRALLIVGPGVMRVNVDLWRVFLCVVLLEVGHSGSRRR